MDRKPSAIKQITAIVVGGIILNIINRFLFENEEGAATVISTIGLVLLEWTLGLSNGDILTIILIVMVSFVYTEVRSLAIGGGTTARRGDGAGD